MDTDAWRTVLIVAVTTNAALGLGYRVYRFRKGGPKADVWGQAVLAGVLLTMTACLVLGVDWVRWAAVAYAAVFALLAMPVWVLGVLLPMRPGPIDYAFTVTYWALLVVIGVAGLFG